MACGLMKYVRVGEYVLTKLRIMLGLKRKSLVHGGGRTSLLGSKYLSFSHIGG